MSSELFLLSLEPYAVRPETDEQEGSAINLKTPRSVISRAGRATTVDTGVKLRIPKGYVGLLKSEASLNIACGIVTDGIIGKNHDGPIMVKLYNHGDEDHYFAPGDTVAQLVLVPIYSGPIFADRTWGEDE